MFGFNRLIKRFLTLILSIYILTMPVLAHPGGTDGEGGHWNHSAGEYHYHHGYSAHNHYDMDEDGIIDCPYNFENNEMNNYSSYISPKNFPNSRISAFENLLNELEDEQRESNNAKPYNWYKIETANQHTDIKPIIPEWATYAIALFVAIIAAFSILLLSKIRGK